MSRVCLLDTSVLIDLERHPQTAWPSLWKLFEDVFRSNEALVPQAIFDELGDGCVKTWLNQIQQQGCQIILPRSQVQIDCMRDIAFLHEFATTDCKMQAGFIQIEKDRPDGDHELLAHALAFSFDTAHPTFARTPCVVSSERRTTKGSHRIKIPDACDFFSLQHFNLHEFIQFFGPI